VSLNQTSGSPGLETQQTSPPSTALSGRWTGSLAIEEASTYYLKAGLFAEGFSPIAITKSLFALL
jgi:hypothetical protein